MDFASKVEALRMQEKFDSTTIEGLVLQRRFQVGQRFDDGTFSWVYHCSDLRKPGHKLVVKVSSDTNMLQREVRCLEYLQRCKVNSGEKDLIPRVIAKGKFGLKHDSEAEPGLQSESSQ